MQTLFYKKLFLNIEVSPISLESMRRDTKRWHGPVNPGGGGGGGRDFHIKATRVIAVPFRG